MPRTSTSTSTHDAFTSGRRVHRRARRALGPLQPVITRDEFKNTRSRNDAYAAIVAATEAPLQEAIESANRAQSEKIALESSRRR